MLKVRRWSISQAPSSTRSWRAEAGARLVTGSIESFAAVQRGRHLPTTRLSFLPSALVLAGAVVASLATRAPPACRLSLELVDAVTGKAVSGLVRIEDPAGKAVLLEGLL